MDITELRSKECIEYVEESDVHGRTGNDIPDYTTADHWLVMPTRDAYDREQSLQFILSLNARYDKGHGFTVPKGKIR